MDETLQKIQKLSVSLALVNRRHYFAGSNRHENDAEHTLSVALLCWYILEKHKLGLDFSKVLKYVMAHDLVEVYAGDFNTFSTDSEKKDKERLEKQSLKKLSKELADFPGLVDSIKKYEEKSDLESQFVWMVDKMQALILADLDGWRPHREAGITFNQFEAKYKELLEKNPIDFRPIFESVVEYSKTTYYGQQK